MNFVWKGPYLSPPMVQVTKDLGLCFCDYGIPILVKKSDDFRLLRTSFGIEILYSKLSQLCRAFGLIAQEFAENGNNLMTPIEQTPIFSNLGLMLDTSRGAVPLVETLYSFMRKMSIMGYNRLMLYTEDTYRIPEQPWFGYLRGSYTTNELQELDDYAKQLGIELIPCIQTLAHLERFLHWPVIKERYADMADVLLTDNSDVDILLEQMFKSIRKSFSSNNIHIGMDEAIGLGLGRHLSLHGYEEPVKIMLRHLKKVCKLAQKYGFNPTMWSDMFFRLLSSTGDYYDVTELPKNLKSELPPNLQLVYWDYYHSDFEFYYSKLKVHKLLDDNVAFAGGGWNWIAPVTDYSLCRMRSIPALEACKKSGLNDVWLTLWGDDGAEANIWSSLLVMQMYAEYCYNYTTKESILFERFEFCCGGSAKAFTDLSFFNRPKCMGIPICELNVAKFLLYQDPLLGLMDEDIRGIPLNESYKKLFEEYTEYAKGAKEPFFSLYTFYAYLAETLELKAEIGLEIKTAYDQNNIILLRKLSSQKLPSLQAKVLKLQLQWQKNWMNSNNPIGYEVHDIRLGGLISRIKTSINRIDDYVNGKISTIPELQINKQPFLSIYNPMHACFFWQDIATASKL